MDDLEDEEIDAWLEAMVDPVVTDEHDYGTPIQDSLSTTTRLNTLLRDEIKQLKGERDAY